MRLLVGIDDTDSVDSDHGTGRVSRDLGAELAAAHDLAWVGSVRQQFLVDDRVPYTTHNSAACLVFEADDDPSEAVVADAGAYLADVMADVADPGLCVAPLADVPATVTAFGHHAQTDVVEKREAYAVAEDAGVFLDEYGGTGDGVIGALGAVGLTAAGEDGRFIAYGDIREYGSRVEVSRLRADGIAVVDTDGRPVEAGVVNTHGWVRPQLRHGGPRLPVEPDGDGDGDLLKPANL
jgi:tRNA(Ile2) C34 agmatinyltransferase TiaS